jgi:hypothetical protein
VRDRLRLEPGTPADSSEDRRWGDGFEIETLINVRVHAAGLDITEVPSYEHRRLHGVSNLNAVSDGLRVLRTIAFERRAERAIAEQRPIPPEVHAAAAVEDPVTDGPELDTVDLDNVVAELEGAAVEVAVLPPTPR